MYIWYLILEYLILILILIFLVHQSYNRLLISIFRFLKVKQIPLLLFKCYSKYNLINYLNKNLFLRYPILIEMQDENTNLMLFSYVETFLIFSLKRNRYGTISIIIDAANHNSSNAVSLQFRMRNYSQVVSRTRRTCDVLLIIEFRKCFTVDMKFRLIAALHYNENGNAVE